MYANCVLEELIHIPHVAIQRILIALILKKKFFKKIICQF